MTWKYDPRLGATASCSAASILVVGVAAYMLLHSACLCGAKRAVLMLTRLFGPEHVFSQACMSRLYSWVYLSLATIEAVCCRP